MRHFRLFWAIFDRSHGNFGPFLLSEGSIGCGATIYSNISVICKFSRVKNGRFWAPISVFVAYTFLVYSIMEYYHINFIVCMAIYHTNS